MRPDRLALAAAAALCLVQPAESQPVAAESRGAPAAVPIHYGDLADLALAAPLVAHVRVARAQALSQREAPDVPAGRRRFLVDADIVTLIRGASTMSAQISYLVDLRDDARGRAARIARHTEYLLFAAPAQARPGGPAGALRLVAPDAQIAYAPAIAEHVRAILREAAAGDAPPRITGIGRAFNVAGSLPGESETQIFLQTADDRPISLNVLRRPGETPRWSVALSEIVDDAAAPPRPDTLLWYRLACTLPAALPAQSLSEASESEAAVIRDDYRLVMRGLGPCVRGRARS